MRKAIRHGTRRRETKLNTSQVHSHGQVRMRFKGSMQFPTNTPPSNARTMPKILLLIADQSCFPVPAVFDSVLRSPRRDERNSGSGEECVREILPDSPGQCD